MANVMTSDMAEDKQRPLVSIICLAYNHAGYIKQCLDGFVMQKTNFRYEIIIHDDASTDGTADIIRKYEAEYPELFVPIYQITNQYSKGISIGKTFLYPLVKGRYIAECEGDDYWTDPYKLQKQVDFLESHPGYVMCSHRWREYMQTEDAFSEIAEFPESGVEYDLNTLVHGKWFFQPLTVVYRRDALDLDRFTYKYAIDVVLFYELLKQGKGYCLPDVMAVYRIHSGGVWSKIALDRQRKMEFDIRLDIYDREKSDEAATFILSEFARNIGRRWMLKHIGMMCEVSRILSRHFGFSFTAKMMLNKFLFNKLLDSSQLNRCDS